MLTDSIGDMLVRIKNAVKARHTSVKFPSSGLKKRILDVMRREGYINDYKISVDNNKEFITVEFKIIKNKNMLLGLKRISKPSRRIYMSKDELKKFFGKPGFVIVSTSKGVFTHKEAIQRGVGGEVICAVW